MFILMLDPENMGVDTLIVMFTCLDSELLEITVF